jgi:hypothetical protein
VDTSGTVAAYSPRTSAHDSVFLFDCRAHVREQRRLIELLVLLIGRQVTRRGRQRRSR